MRSNHGITLLLLLALMAHAAPASAQSADLVVVLSASHVSGLRVGDEVLISTTVRNDGPSPASGVFVSAGQGQWEVFLYELVGSESPECGAIDQIDLDPPQYSFFWSEAEVPVGGSVTCTARLRVIRVPGNYASAMYAFAQPQNPMRDPDIADNFAQLSLSFAPPARATSIPAMSLWAFVATVAGVLLGGSCLPRR